MQEETASLLPSWRDSSTTSRLFGVEEGSSFTAFSRPSSDLSKAQYSIFDKNKEISPSASPAFPPPRNTCCPLCLLTLSTLSASIGNTPPAGNHLLSSPLIDLLDDISVILFLRLCLYHTSDFQETHVSLPSSSSSSPSTLSSLDRKSRSRRTVEKAREPCRDDDERQLSSSSSSAYRQQQSAVQGRDNRRLLRRDNRRPVGSSPLSVPSAFIRTEGAITDPTESLQGGKKRGLSQQTKSSLSIRKKRKRGSLFSSPPFLLAPSCREFPSQSQLLQACREGLSTLFSPGASWFPSPRCIYTGKKSPRISQDTQQRHHDDRICDPLPPCSPEFLFSQENNRRDSFHREERREEDRSLPVQSHQPFSGGGEEGKSFFSSSSHRFLGSSSSFRDCGQRQSSGKEEEPVRKLREIASTEKEEEEEGEDCDMGEREENFTGRRESQRKQGEEVCCCLHRYFPSHDEIREVDENDEGERERRRKTGDSYEDMRTLSRLGGWRKSKREESSSLLSSSFPSFLLSQRSSRRSLPSSVSYIGVLHLLHAQLSCRGLPGVWVWMELLHLVKKSTQSFSFFFAVLQDVFSLLSWSAERMVMKFLRHLSSPDFSSSPSLLYCGEAPADSLHRDRKGGAGSREGEEEEEKNEVEEKVREHREVDGRCSPGVCTLEWAGGIPWRRRKNRLLTGKEKR